MSVGGVVGGGTPSKITLDILKTTVLNLVLWTALSRFALKIAITDQTRSETNQLAHQDIELNKKFTERYRN